MPEFVIVMETDVADTTGKTNVRQVLQLMPNINSWTIDTGDSQKVLRIISSTDVSHEVENRLRVNLLPLQPWPFFKKINWLPHYGA